MSEALTCLDSGVVEVFEDVHVRPPDDDVIDKGTCHHRMSREVFASRYGDPPA